MTSAAVSGFLRICGDAQLPISAMSVNLGERQQAIWVRNRFEAHHREPATPDPFYEPTSSNKSIAGVRVQLPKPGCAFAKLAVFTETSSHGIAHKSD